MDIINKFKNFELSQEDRIPKEDKENCERIQAIYEQTLSVYKKWYDIYHENSKLNQEHNRYGLQINDLSICETIGHLHENLIYRIYRYFSNKYKIDIKQPIINDFVFKYNYSESTIDTNPLNYKTYVDEILKQLNGLSFENMRIKQLKENLKNICKNNYSDKWNIDIKANIIKFNDLLSWTKYTWENDYKLYDQGNLLLLESALSFFEYRKEIGFSELKPIKQEYIVQWNNIENDIKITSQKIKSIKLFKNGRVDVKFSSSKFAREFIKCWCGYPLSDVE